MRLYLVQHGRCLPKEVDPDRPLSDNGRAEMEKIGSFLGRCRPLTVTRISHSGKTRARQTAELLAKHIEVAMGIGADNGLDPLDDPAIWAARVKNQNADVMLVGHLPYLARLASLLTTGNSDGNVIAFHNGGVVCLERDAAGTWLLAWAVIPEILR